MSSDIRKWFMKQHDKGNGSASKPEIQPATEKLTLTIPEKKVPAAEESSARKKTSKYFAKEPAPKEAQKDEKAPPTKRKIQDEVKIVPKPSKKLHIEESDDGDEDDDFVGPTGKRKPAESKPTPKKLKTVSGAGVKGKSAQAEYDVEEEEADEEIKPAAKGGGKGRGGSGRGQGSVSTTGRGRGRGGGGRGGFMNFGERKEPPHKGEKEVPEGAPECLSGLTFVISGTLDSLEREEAEDLIKRHGGRVTGSISKKTGYLLADEDIGGNKSSRAKELGVPFLTEDGLFDMIRKSKPAKATPAKNDSKKDSPVKVEKKSPIKSSPIKLEKKDDQDKGVQIKDAASMKSSIPPVKKKGKSGITDALQWTEKYRPKTPSEIVSNQSLIKQLQEWLKSWDKNFLHSGEKGKGKKQSDSGAKKAVLLSGSPGIGKSTTAKLVSQALGYQAIEVNASDNRGKADSKIGKGIGGNTSNSIKELVSNATLNYGKDRSKHPKSVLIMDEVDGMSAGDRGGVADLIASIKISKIPIICICNDRYSQKLKSLVNYCLLLNYRKLTKQQMAKRLIQIASAEGVQINEIVAEELADRTNGDMRMAVNQLQYMSLQKSVINYDDMKTRLQNSAKDEDISPFTAVERLFGFNSGKLRMDERIDLSMSDPDLVPLIIQENYINYKPSAMGKDESGVKRMKFLARAAESIADGDIVNVQIRRYRQWQLSQASTFASSIVPAALMHGSREILEPGERNFNRFGGWLGKNSTMGKNFRLLEDVHVHVLASQQTNLDRGTLRLDYFTPLLRQLINPLRSMSKDEAVKKVVEFMDTYSLSQEDFDTIVELSKFQGCLNPMEGIQPAVKAALTKAYKQGGSSRVVKAADLINLPGIKKAPKKRIQAILEPVEAESPDESKAALAEADEQEDDDNSSDAEKNDELAAGDSKPKLDLQSDKSKGIQVQLDLKDAGTGSKGKKATPASKLKGSETTGKGAGRGSGGKRKR